MYSCVTGPPKPSAKQKSYIILYNHKINVLALIGQSAMGYCASKPTKNCELLYKSNRPQVSIGYRLKNHLGCWQNTRRTRKPLACGSWFTNSSRVLPTSRVVYQLLLKTELLDYAIREFSLAYPSWVMSHCYIARISLNKMSTVIG